MTSVRCNYVNKILSLRAAGLLPVRVGENDFVVYHDDDCPILGGSRECTCDPDIVLNGAKINPN